MQKYNNQRVFSCIFEQKTISEQIDLILAHCVMVVCNCPLIFVIFDREWKPFITQIMSTSSAKGFYMDVWYILEKRLNFSTHITRAHFNSNRWANMINELVENRYDIRRKLWFIFWKLWYELYSLNFKFLTKKVILVHTGWCESRRTVRSSDFSAVVCIGKINLVQNIP